LWRERASSTVRKDPNLAPASLPGLFYAAVLGGAEVSGDFLPSSPPAEKAAGSESIFVSVGIRNSIIASTIQLVRSSLANGLTSSPASKHARAIRL
jgi:hypothetical protein